MSSLSNRKYTYDKLGIVNGAGLDIALYPQIRDAIAERMKEIYGNDIDLSTASADGQYINMESLVIDNIYKLINLLFINLNPNTAGGKYLDILCSLSNITRVNETRSKAQVVVYPISTLGQINTITLQDRNGLLWKWINPVDPSQLDTNVRVYSFTSGDPVELTFECESFGANEATAGTQIVDGHAITNISDIDWTLSNFIDTNGTIYLDTSNQFKVYQIKDAIVGKSNESDSSLRARKNKYISENSTTTLDSLESALYNLEGIKDVYIINNVTGSTIPGGTITIPNDGTNVNNHNVYICLRYEDGYYTNVNPNNLNYPIGLTIYNKMTPGILTTPYGGTPETDGNPKNETFVVSNSFSTTVHWKMCLPVSPTIVVNFTYSDNYIKGDGITYSKSEQAIVTAMKNYFDSIKINELLLPTNIMQAMISGDIRPNGLNSFFPTGCTINGSTNSYLPPMTFVKYTSFVFDYTNGNTKLTISTPAQI